MSLFESDHEVGALIDWYSDGGCLTFAYALHWMCGWAVKGLSDGEDYAHFSAVGPDGLAWDAAGPRSLEQAAESYVDQSVWEDVDAYKFISTSGASEGDITDACKAAMTIFGNRLTSYIKRTPQS